ncbi:hypothetical protein [uncultured Rhodospira sp.]|uniref:hypothetical protein n=1 Tax=uncultured Rhodospira sp. TaxID=1936189 RepID=UPI002637425C|nr:hypothetical protein [uncultured Rhodospira sp.]
MPQTRECRLLRTGGKSVRELFGRQGEAASNVLRPFMIVRYEFGGQTCVSRIGQPVSSGWPNEFMVTVQTEGSEKTREIYGNSEANATDNAMTFLRSLADDESIVILDD